MEKRQLATNKAIVAAIQRDEVVPQSDGQLFRFFHLYHTRLMRGGKELLGTLRTEAWGIDEAEYKESFRGDDQDDLLRPVGDLGYSGSTFFVTPDANYIIKGLPRRFEYAFFERDMMGPYYRHMKEYPSCLLVRITDYLVPAYRTLGTVTQLVPGHHVVMENILSDKPSTGGEHGGGISSKWETYDLKPTGYFYPRRDLVPEQFTSEERLRKIITSFPDKIVLSQQHATHLKSMLERDTAFLQTQNVVDYSLFLVRVPAASKPPPKDSHSADSPSWRQGVPSADGKWIYRIILLDFMWAKHKLWPRMMTILVRTFTRIVRLPDMSITTTPEDYRQMFLEMMARLVEVRG